MVTRLKDNISYVRYIQREMKSNFPEWEEVGVAFEGEPNDNFGITLKKDPYQVQFMKDRGLLELNLYYSNEPVRFGYLLYNSIIKKIPDQDPKWRLTICTELIDFYVSFLKEYLLKN